MIPETRTSGASLPDSYENALSVSQTDQTSFSTLRPPRVRAEPAHSISNTHMINNGRLNDK